MGLVPYKNKGKHHHVPGNVQVYNVRVLAELRSGSLTSREDNRQGPLFRAPRREPHSARAQQPGSGRPKGARRHGPDPRSLKGKARSGLLGGWCSFFVCLLCVRVCFVYVRLNHFLTWEVVPLLRVPRREVFHNLSCRKPKPDCFYYWGPSRTYPSTHNDGETHCPKRLDPFCLQETLAQ